MPDSPGQPASEPSPQLAAVSAAVARCEQAQAACEAAREKLHLAPADAFDSAWQDYERCRAAFDFAVAEAQVAIEDAHLAFSNENN